MAPSQKDLEAGESVGKGPSWETPLRRSYVLLIARLAIMGMLAIFIAGTTLSTWWWTSCGMRSSVTQLGESLRQELLNRTADRFGSFLTLQSNTASLLARIAQAEYRENGNILSEQVRMAAFYQSQARAEPFSMGIHTLNGQYFYIQNTLSSSEPLNTTLFFCNTSQVTGGRPINFVAALNSETGALKGPPELWNTPLNSSDREYVKGALRMPGQPSVGLLESALGNLVITVSITIAHPDTGAVIGVVVTTQTLHKVSQYMSSLDLRGGHMFVMTNDRYLVATSDKELYRSIGINQKTLRRANESSTLLVRAADAYLAASVAAETLTSQSTNSGNVNLLGKDYYVDTLPLQNTSLPMVAVILLPRASIMRRIDERDRSTIIFLLVLSGSTFVVGCILVTLLTSRVSTEMRMKVELEELKRRAEANSNAKSLFLSNMSHELRTPMAGIMGLLDILLLDQLTPEQELNVTQIRQCATGLLGLLNDLLDIGKIEAGKLELESAEFDVGAELESLVDMFSVQCQNKGIEIGLDLHDSMARVVKGDQARVRQIFANLLSNAIKFSSAGGHVVVRGWPSRDKPVSPSRYVTTFPTSATPPPPPGRRWWAGFSRWWRPGRPLASQKDPSSHHSRGGSSLGAREPLLELVFEVEDTGIGIPPDKWEKVFENFVQADPSTTRLHGGTGLGLGIVRSLVNMMGGDIRVVGKASAGTLIRFRVFFEGTAPAPPPGVPCSSSMQVRAAKKLAPAVGALAGAHLLLGMPGDVGRRIAARWLAERGLGSFHEARTWEEFLAKGKKLIGQLDCPPGRRNGDQVGWKSEEGLGEVQILIEQYRSRPMGEGAVIGTPVIEQVERGDSGGSKQVVFLVVDIDCFGLGEIEPAVLDKYLRQLAPLQGRAVMGWLVSSATPSAVRQALRLWSSTAVICSKPLYASRLLELLSNMAHQARASPPPPLKVLPGLTEAPPPPLGGGMSPSRRCNSFSREELLALAAGSQQKPPLGETTSPGPHGGSHEGSARGEPNGRKGVASDEIEVQVASPTTPEGGTPTTPHGALLGWEGEGKKGGERSPLAGGGGEVKPPLAGLRVLVAEDTAVLQRLTLKMLEKMGAAATAVGDGEKAVEAILRPAEGALPFDCVLMDCQMPKLDGYGASRAIREGEKGTGECIPIIALTAHAMACDREKCLEAGMTAYLTKPISAKLLVATMLECVPGRQKRN